MATPPNTDNKIKQGASDFWDGLVDFFKDLVNLQDGMDREGTIINIRNNKRMRGANAWLLMCSIMVASLGLNLNSPAVIIGAMLISPLMSPILGVGLSVGINDRRGLLVSLQHFGLSIAIALITSILYFKISPIDVYTSEIAGRTQPTVLDLMVAIFGGFAGIISSSRKDKSNAIPGVAIATALMPPLCVTGYGLSHGLWDVALNSFYLFFLNSFFIALTTYIVVRLLDFPNKTYQNEKERQKTQYIIIGFAILLAAPSFYILSKVRDKMNQKIEIVEFAKQVLPNSEIDINDDSRQDSMSVRISVPRDIPADTMAMIYQQFNDLNCRAKYKIIDVQNSGLTQADLSQATDEMKKQFFDDLERKQAVEQGENEVVLFLKNQLDSLQRADVIFNDATKELRALFPDIQELRYGKMAANVNDSTNVDLPILMVKWDKNTRKNSLPDKQERIANFMRIRAKLDTLQVVTF